MSQIQQPQQEEKQQDPHIRLNHRQMAWLVAVVFIAGGLISLSKALITFGNNDAWFGEIFGVIYAFAVAYFFYVLAKKFPGKNIFEITFTLCGKWIGGLVNFLFLLHFWMVIVRDVSLYTDFMNTTLLLKTPHEMLIFMFTLVAIYYSRVGVEMTARVNDLIFPLFFLALLSLPVLLGNEFSFSRMEPILGHGISPVIKSNILASGWYGDILIVGAFMHTIASARQLHAAVRHGIALSSFCLTLMIALCIAVLGASVAGRTLYPNYTLVEQIHITDFLDRMELLFFSVWLPAFLVKVIFLYQALINCINSFSNKHNNALYAKPVGWLLMLTTIASFKSITEVFDFGNYGAVVVNMVMHPPLYLLLFFLALRRKNRYKEDDELNSENSKPSKKQQGEGFFAWVTRVPLGTWLWTSNGLVLLSVSAIVVGALFGRDVTLIGYIAGGVFAFAVTATVFSTYLEMRRVNDLHVKSKKRKQADRNTA